MELQLGLALPSNPSSKGLDLNSCAYEPKDLIFSSFPWNHKKRSFTQLSEHDHRHTNINNTEVQLLPTLALLPLTPGHPNNHDEDPEHHHHRISNFSTITKNDGDDVEAPMGWPPVNSWRKKLRYDIYNGDEAEGNDQMVWIHQHHHHQSRTCGSVVVRGSSSLYVKVKMEGVGIARKVDLSMHHSFQTLKETLMDMFGKCHLHSNCYKLTYQDKEGDWMLAEDVPWRSFIGCAQRLKLLKSSG